MGSKKNKKVVEEPPQEEVEEEEEEEEEIEEELELLQVDVGDIIKVKQILDETVAGTIVSDDVSSHGEKVYLDEEYRHDNLKLYLMFQSCVFAAYAQFGLAKVNPNENRLLLGVCCAAYFCISGILQLIMTFIDKDCIMMTQPLSDPDMITLVKSSGNKEMGKYGIRVRTQFPRFSEYYTVLLEFQGKVNSDMVKETWSVGQFFDVDGYFDEEGLMLEVEKLYRRFEAGKFDKPGDGKKVAGGKGKKKKA